jgi:acetyl esterase/lipase
MWKKLSLAVVAGLAVLAAAAYTAFQLSPWPAVWLIRHSFDAGAAEASASVAGLVPTDGIARYGISYAPGDPDAVLDVYAPAAAKIPLPAVVWVHGGGFVSGSRKDLDGYLRILAARGFVTVAVDYTTAPEARFPTPLRQTSAALAHVRAEAGRYGIDPDRIFLAGDSAGAQIAAQTALAISDPAYARQVGLDPGFPRAALRGVVLYCGPYDATSLNFEGSFGAFMRTVIWAYAGTPDPRDPRVAALAVTPHLTAGFPPAFVSVGNADPLAPQSYAFAAALRARGSEVETLFFPDDRRPSLDHEYQLLVATEAGRLALDRSVAFLEAHAGGAFGEKPAR